MSERYWITGVQLGMLKTVKTPLVTRFDIVEEIIDKQFIGNIKGGEKEMSEKVLGFKEKNAYKQNTLAGIPHLEKEYQYTVKEKDLVSVRLASESVGLKALKKYCEQNELRIERQELEENSYPIVFESRRLALLGDGDFVINKRSLIEWAEKEAKKK